MQFNLCISNTYQNAFKQVLNRLPKEDSISKHFFIVPDRMTLTTEKSIFEHLNISSTFNIEVITLSKFANKVLKNTLATKKLLNKQSGVMLTTKAILNNTKELKAFQKAVKLKGFAANIFETINQLKSCNITVEELKESYKNSNRALTLKLDDISLIYTTYEHMLKEEYIDASTKLNLLLEVLPHVDFIKNSHFYFALFDNFTPQQYKIIDGLVQYAKSVTVGFTSNTKQNNAHLYPNKMYESLTTIAKNYGMNVKDIIANETEHKNAVFNHILYNFRGFQKEPMLLKDNSIQLFEAESIKEEVEFVASKILTEITVFQNRYNNLNVVVADLQKYAPTIEEVFRNYNIPFYLDKSKVLTEHIYVKFLLQILTVVKNGWNQTDVLNLTKNYFLNFSKEEKNAFEDFVLKYNVNYTQFLNEFDKDLVKENKLAEQVRAKLIGILSIFVGKEKNKVEGYVALVKEFLNEQKVEALLTTLQTEYETQKNLVEEKLTQQVYEKTNAILNNLEELLKEQDVTFEEFYNLLEEGLLATTLSTIPIGVDSVFVGDASNNNFFSSKVLFVLGATEESLPQTKGDVGIILDDELNMLTTKEKLSPSIFETNKLAKFNLFQLLLTPAQKLVVSYARMNEAQKEQKPSFILDELQALFFILENGQKKKLPIYSALDEAFPYEKEERKALYYSLKYANQKVGLQKLLQTVKADFEDNVPYDREQINSLYWVLVHFYGEKEVNKWFDLFIYENKIENIENAAELFFYKERTTISQIERYFVCPFKHFIDYGLRLKEKERATLRPLDVGNILHKVAEVFGKELLENKIKTYGEVKKVATAIIDNILLGPEYFYTLNNVEYKNLIESLKEEGIRLAQAIFKEQEDSKFKLSKLEYAFGIKEKETALTLNVKGQEIKFGGVIDRIDFYENYFRIIDYKTGKSDFNLKDLYYGNKIQLFIYSSVVRMLTGKKPAGIFYFPIKNEFKEEDYLEKHSLYQLQGAFLDDLNIIKAFDKNLTPASPQSQILKIKVNTKENEFTDLEYHTKKLALSDRQFERVEEYAKKVSIKALEQILDGNITPSPYSDGKLPCEYCMYHTVCKFSEVFKNTVRTPQNKIAKETFEEVGSNG